MNNFSQQIKRIDYTIEEINKLNVTTPYYFLTDSLIQFQDLLFKTVDFLKKYTEQINDDKNIRGIYFNKYLHQEIKSLINDVVSRISLDLREIERKESSEAYILANSLLKDLIPSIPFIISASKESGHGGTFSFKEYVTDFLMARTRIILDAKINDKTNFENYLTFEKRIHLINYNAQDLKMNAFHWCLLYHEAFHIFDKEINPIDEFKADENHIDLVNDKYNKNKEIMVDILSTIYCGLPYPYSISQLLKETPETDYEHLNPIVRLLLVKKCLDELRKEYQLKYKEKIMLDGEDEGDFEIMFLDSFDKVMANIDSVRESLKSEENEDDKNQGDYIEKNFIALYQHAKQILHNNKINCFIEQINTTDETVKNISFDMKKISDYCSLSIPPIVHPILLFNGLLNVFLQKDIYIQDERIKNSWNKSEGEINKIMLDLLKMSLKKWWATKEFYLAQQKIVAIQ